MSGAVTLPPLGSVRRAVMYRGDNWRCDTHLTGHLFNDELTATRRAHIVDGLVMYRNFLARAAAPSPQRYHQRAAFRGFAPGEER